MSWREYEIGDFLTRRKDPLKIRPDADYKLVTIRMYHKGVVKRGEVKGISIKSPTMYKVSAGQFILSGIDARNGAFGIVPSELEGAVVTNDFWTHDIDTSIIDIDFFYWFTTTAKFYDACIKASEGTTNRQRLQADKFYSFKVLLPSLDEQREWLKRLNAINKKHKALNQELSQQQSYLQLLRQTILQEAVQGKLTKQDESDEPASELLKRIKAEKQKLIKEGKLKKEKELPPITEEEIPFELPKGWVWCRLKELGFIIGGGTPSTSNAAYWNGDVPWITPKDMKADFLSDAEVKVTIEGVNNSSAKLIPPGSILVVGRSGILKRTLPVCINMVECVVNQDLKVIVPYAKELSRYIQLMLQGHEELILQKLVKYGMTVHSLMYQEFEMQPFPLPPLAEQQRIVAKVQQLQQHINNLEAQVQQSQQYAQHLLQTVLKEAFTGKEKQYEVNEELSLAAEE